MKLKRTALAAVLLMGISAFGQTSGRVQTLGTATTTGGTLVAPNIPDLGGCTGCVAWTDGGSLTWRNADFLPSETRKPITPGVTIMQVRAAAKRVEQFALASPSYIRTAKALKVNSAAIDEANLMQELHDHALKVYDYGKVDQFLYNMALKMGANTRWVWKPLRDRDMERAFTDNTVRPEMGFVYRKQYSRAVPERILNVVASLLECVPDAVFLVSDFEVFKPDPFLAITTNKLMLEGKIFIIANWDEPGFKDAPEVPFDFVANAVHAR